MKVQQGFTLIELLIVIAIIGVLAAVLIPNLIESRKAAVDTGARQLARNAATLAEMKRADNSSRAIVTGKSDCVPLLLDSLSPTIARCEFKQDSEGTYVLTESSNGKFFHFNGATLLGPLTSAPSGW